MDSKLRLMICSDFGGLSCKHTVHEKDFIYKEKQSWFNHTGPVREPEAVYQMFYTELRSYVEQVVVLYLKPPISNTQLKLMQPNSNVLQ